jgi:medium-chain acyl-[acyl-carrier-protein] hydrolase
MELFLPILRADFELLGSYRYDEDAPLNCPLSAFGGWGDQQATQPDLAAWRSQTYKSFSLKMFPGDHFYIQSARPALVQALVQYLFPYSTRLS